MDITEWILEASLDDALPDAAVTMLEPILWCAANGDTVLKIIGNVPCDERERQEIKDLLLKASRWELLAAMLYCENDACPAEDRQASGTLTYEPTGRFEALSMGQFASFLRWCDDAERRVLLEAAPPVECLRMLYIALNVGYRKLALALAGRLNAEGVAEAAVPVLRNIKGIFFFVILKT